MGRKPGNQPLNSKPPARWRLVPSAHAYTLDSSDYLSTSHLHDMWLLRSVAKHTVHPANFDSYLGANLRLGHWSIDFRAVQLLYVHILCRCHVWIEVAVKRDLPCLFLRSGTDNICKCNRAVGPSA